MGFKRMFHARKDRNIDPLQLDFSTSHKHNNFRFILNESSSLHSFYCLLLHHLQQSAIKMTSNQGPVLVTGGCGYIGSHTIVCLLEQGYNVVVVDNLVNSSKVSLDRVAEIANLDGDARKERLVFYEVDLCDKEALKKVFESSPKFSSCIHFAGLKVRVTCQRQAGTRFFVHQQPSHPFSIHRLSERVPKSH